MCLGNPLFQVGATISAVVVINQSVNLLKKNACKDMEPAP